MEVTRNEGWETKKGEECNGEELAEKNLLVTHD